jgi:cytochrome c biogenesis protein CcdA/thiol-disulfide isomerase/thioredoxin
VIVLLTFAVLAGAGTALSPCVLPVLPALLSAGGAGGRRRPLGVVLGLSITFAVTIIGIAKVVDGVGLGSDPLRLIAVVVLVVFGGALIVPSVAARIEAPLSRLSALGPRTRGDGFRSGLLVGGALGFVYTPCAGPILAAVISVSAASGATARSIEVAIAYTLGSAASLLVLTLGGRALAEKLRGVGRGPTLQRVLGVVMVLTAVAIVTNLDVRFDEFVAGHIPDVNLTASLEKSHVVSSRLGEITKRKPKFVAANGTAAQGSVGAAASALPDLGTAPNFTDNQDWFNTPGDHPLSLKSGSLRGRVVLVDFWTYTCINCIRTLPYLKAWDAKYRQDGLTIVGVETPEFQFEHEASNVKSAIKQFGIHYPVVQDNNYGTWDAYSNEYWPADYLIDSTGQVRYISFGEGDYDKTEAAIRSLLTADGSRALGSLAKPHDVVVPSTATTPETYLGTERAAGWLPKPLNGLHSYGSTTDRFLALNEFSFGGTWKIAAQPATAVSAATIDAEVQARHVYLVLSSADSKPRTVQVLLDGHPISSADAGADVHHGRVTVTGERLYTLVSLPSDQRHHLTLRLAPGITGYAFTFG